MITADKIRTALRKERDDWSSDFPQGSVFDDCLTLDPQEVDAAWARLSIDTRIEETKLYPETLHQSLIKTLSTRNPK